MNYSQLDSRRQWHTTNRRWRSVSQYVPFPRGVSGYVGYAALIFAALVCVPSALAGYATGFGDRATVMAVLGSITFLVGVGLLYYSGHFRDPHPFDREMRPATSFMSRLRRSKR